MEQVRLWLSVTDMADANHVVTLANLEGALLEHRVAAQLLREVADQLDPLQLGLGPMAGADCGMLPAELEPTAGALGPAPATRDPLGLDQRAQLDDRSAAQLDQLDGLTSRPTDG